MTWPEDVQQRIIRAITARVPRMPLCAVCGRQQWTLASGVVTIQLQEDPGAYVLGGPAMPCAALVCQHCGNTLLLNLVVLGLGDLAAAKATA